MKNSRFLKWNISFKRAIAIICSLAIVLSLLAGIPIVTKAEKAEKMFVIKPTTLNADGGFSYANVFIPLNFRDVGVAPVGEYTYFKLTFKARSFGTGKPIVGVVRAAGSVDGSYSEPFYTYNNTTSDSHTDANLTCTYDPSTYTYTYIIKMAIGSWYSSTDQDLHSALTIGNAEHNGGWHIEGSHDAYFAFTAPELYAYDTKTGETKGENLLPDLSEENVNLSKVYTHKKANPYTGDDSMLKAPANKWGIDTTASLIEYKDVPDGYFDPDKHNYTKVEAVAPTETESGHKEYYTCDCDDCKGKYFINNGASEVDFEYLYIQPNGPDKAIVIKPNTEGDTYPSNVFIPLDFTKSGTTNLVGNTYYFQLKFKTKLVDGNLPVVGIIRYNPSTGGSYSEPEYSYNNLTSTNSDTKLYAKYDEATMTYTAVIKMNLYSDYFNPSSGVHTALTIGKAEHNGNWYSENDFDSSFIIYQPELYYYNVIFKRPANNINLIQGINNNTVNFEKEYTHRKNPYTSSDTVMNAPANIWSVDGPSRYVSVVDVPADYFDTTKHNYVKHDAVEPTETAGGNVEYYTCDCDSCKDKYFTDFGLTEIKDVNIAPNGPEQTVVLSPNNSGGTAISNIFIPIDHRVADDAIFDMTTRYYQLSFKTKLYGDTMPIVSVIRYDDTYKGSWSEPYYSYNNNASYISSTYSAASSTYDPETETFTAVVAVRTNYSLCRSKSGAHHVIMIGNAEHNGNWYHENSFESTFAIYAPELRLYDTSAKKAVGDNLIPGFNNNTLNFDKVYKHATNPYTADDSVINAPLGKWSIDTTSRLVSNYNVSEDYFDPSNDTDTMLKVTGGNSSTFLSHNATLKTATNYKVDFDYKAENGASVECGLYVLNSSGEMTDISSAGGKFIITDDNVEGAHFSGILSMPTSGANSAGNNFKIVIGIKSKNSDSVAYISEVKVRNLSASGECGNNVLVNGDFAFTGTGKVTSEEQLPAWDIDDSAEYTSLEILPVPAGLFIDTTPNALYLENFKGTATMFATVTSGKTYLFRYKNKYTGDTVAEPYIEFFTNKGSSVTKVSYMRDKDGYYNTVCEFTAPSGLLPAKNIRIGINGSDNLNAVISGFELYELDKNGAIIGKNLISDHTFIKTSSLASYSKDLDEGIWMQQVNSGSMTLQPVDISFFNIARPQMLLFKGTNASGGAGKVYQNMALTAGKKYQLSFNVKYGDIGDDPAKIGAELQYKKSGSFVALSSTMTESDTEYRETYVFTMPTDAQSGENFRFTFHSETAFTSGYLANFTLYELDATGNVIGKNMFSNGDFSTGSLTYWTRSGAFQFLEFSEYPENYFSKVETYKKNMVIYRNTDDYAEIDFSPCLKPGTRYEIRYQELLTDCVVKTDERGGVSIWQFYYDDEGKLVNTAMSTERKVEGTYISRYFTTAETLVTVNRNNNMIIRLYSRAGSAGYWGALELYEVDENGNRLSNNLFINGDFIAGTKTLTIGKTYPIRIVEEPDGFFANWKEPTEMIYSQGTSSNQTYGQKVKLDADKKYYFTGFYVNMNSAGVKPQVQYLPRSEAGTNNYKDIDLEVFYDGDRFYFETLFEIPEDALLVNGMADIRVQMNNTGKGIGYFTDIMLTEEDKYINLLTKPVASNSNYKKMAYDEGVFIFYYNDKKFDDGDWSGEWENSKYNIKIGRVTGRIVDKNGNGISGIKMQLNPGKIAVTTDENGYFAFEDLVPGDYKVYLVDGKTSLYCTSVKVQKGIWSMLPLITYTEAQTIMIEDILGSDSEDDGDSQPYGILRGFYYDRSGKPIAGATIYMRDAGASITDENGMFMFDQAPVGTHELYTVLSDNSEYVFREVIIQENKGIQVNIMEPAADVEDDEESGFDLISILTIVAIVAGSVVVLLAGAFVTLLAIKKKKAKISK